MTNRLDRDFHLPGLLRFALPTIIMMLVVSLYTIVDGVLIARLVGENALAAANVAYPAISVTLAMGIMLGTGGSAVVAHKMGAGYLEEARRDFGFLALVAVCIGLAVCLAGALFAGPLARLLGASDLLLDDTVTYLRVQLCFAPMAMLQLLFESFFVTAGRPGLGLGLATAAGVTNAVLDYLYMGPMQMGILGAALGTVTGYSIPAVAGGVFFLAPPGRGIRGVIQGQRLLAGNRAMLEEAGVPLDGFDAVAEGLAQAGKTPLYFAGDGRMLGVVAVADTPKPTSAEAVRAFQAMGIDVVMLTGDNRRTAEAVGRQLGVNRVVAEVLPQDKEKTVAELQAQGKRVAMVGDGINDAPALARADVGLAIGAGTDVAIESADVVLMKSDLLDAVTAVQLSRKVIRNIKENLFWAFIYNIIGIPLAAGVWYPLFQLQLSPMFGAAAMSLSSVCVVSNALRLKFFRPERRESPAAPVSEGTPKSVETKGTSAMTKTMSINGMMCTHCQAHVEKALNAIDGVEAKVNLEAKTATLTLSKDVSDDMLRGAVTEAGYEVVSIQ